MPIVHFNCPACSQRLSAEPVALRTRMACARCGHEFLPLEAIPRQNTLPAMPAPSVGAPAQASPEAAAERPRAERMPTRPLADELASEAAAFLRAMRARTAGRFGYGLVAAASASPAALGLVALAFFDGPVAHAVAGLLATVALTACMSAGAAQGLLRWRGEHERTAAPSRRALAALCAFAAAALALASSFALLVRWAATPRELAAPAEAAPVPTAAPTLPPEQRADFKLRRDGHFFVGGGVLHVPPSFRSDDGAFDLLIHFHGNTLLVEESVASADVNALVYVMNLGLGSGPYEKKFMVPGVFDETLDKIEEGARKRGLAGAKLRRVALSAWSAGYGAVGRILESKKNVERVDALLVLDGIHVSYLDARTKELDPLKLEPWVRFATLAAEGSKLFTLTHSEVQTTTYANTRETSDALLAAVGATRTDLAETPPKVTLAASVGVMPKKSEQRLEQTTDARKGQFHVRGYVGQTTEHHMAHLVQMSVTVLPELSARWK